MFTKALSQFIGRTNYEDLPPEAVAAAKGGILDYVGVTLSGSKEPVARKMAEVAEDDRARREATVISTGKKTSCSLAAWANGTTGHALDFDDCIHIEPMALGHPTTTIFPAALAVGEKLNVSGKELITAYCLGMEAYAKMGLFLREEAFNQGWHNTAVFGTVGATAAVGKLLKLNETQMCRGFGIAASLAGGLRRNFGTMVKPLHAGNAARNGVDAGRLAARDFTAWETILEAPRGFHEVFTGKAKIPEKTPEELSAALGNPWSIFSPGLSVKLYPCCRGTHNGVDAALYLKQKHSLDWRQIEAVECHVPRRLESILSYHAPKTALEAKFSLEYCFARALIDGWVKIGDFTDARVRQPEVTDLISKIKWVYPSQEEEAMLVAHDFVVKGKDGKEYRSQVMYPKGEPQNPVSREEIVTKYRDCASGFLSREMSSQMEDLLLNLERVEKISKITRIIAQARKG